MDYEGLRPRLLRALMKMAKVPQGTMPRWIQVIRNILYPIKYFYELNTTMRYMWENDTYIVEGVRFSRNFLRSLKEDDEVVLKFRKDYKGNLYIESIDKNI